MTTAKKKPTTTKATAQAKPETTPTGTVATQPEPKPIAEKAEHPEIQEGLPQVQIEGEKTPEPETQESLPEAQKEAVTPEPSPALAAEAPKAKRQVLKVTATGESFRRANLQFGRKARLLFVDDLSEAQLKMIRNEPRLVVVEDVIDEVLDDAEE